MSLRHSPRSRPSPFLGHRRQARDSCTSSLSTPAEPNGADAGRVATDGGRPRIAVSGPVAPTRPVRGPTGSDEKRSWSSTVATTCRLRNQALRSGVHHADADTCSQSIQPAATGAAQATQPVHRGRLLRDRQRNGVVRRHPSAPGCVPGIGLTAGWPDSLLGGYRNRSRMGWLNDWPRLNDPDRPLAEGAILGADAVFFAGGPSLHVRASR